MKLFFGSFYSYEVQLFHAFSMTIFPFAFSSDMLSFLSKKTNKKIELE